MTCPYYDVLFAGVSALTPDMSVLENAFVAVKGSRIAYVGRAAPEESAQTVISGPRLVLMPGLVNAHTHLPMSLLRSYCDDRELHDWLFIRILPAEARLTAPLAGLGARLSMLECIAGGVTCVIDMYDHCLAIAEAADEAGISANLSCACVQPGGDYAFEDSKDYRSTVELVNEWHGRDGGRIRVDASVHAEYTSTDKLWLPFARYAEDNNLRVHVHVSETKKEHEECKARHGGKTPARVLDEAGVWRASGLAAHCVWLEDGDMDILASRGVSAVHCPVSNFKLASGVARVPEMRERGLNVALGTDGVASNNSHDMFEEMKLAAMAQLRTGAVTARDALYMAAMGGAKAAGRGDESGAIEAGRFADLVLLDFDKPHLTPCHNIASHLVYCARGSDVKLTMARGRTLYKDGEFLTLDRERILFEAAKAASIFPA